jgi:capsular exopolysaccharide synthesis family protein
MAAACSHPDVSETTINLPALPNNGHDAQYKLTVMAPKRRYFSYLRERWWVVLACLALAVSAVVAFETLRPETYISHAQLYLTLAPRLSMGVFTEVKDDYATQIELLKGSHLRGVAMEKVPASASLKSPLTVDVVRPMATSILQLRVSSSDAAVSQEFLKALIDAYLAFKKDTRLSTTKDLVDSLTDQLLQRDVELKTNQDKWLDFQKTNNLPVLEEESKSDGLYLAELERQVARLRLDEGLLNRGLSPEVSGGAAPTNLPNAAVSTPVTNITGASLAAAATNTPPPGGDTALRTARLQLAVVRADHERLLKTLSPMHLAVKRHAEEVERLAQTVAILEQQAEEQKRIELKQVRERIAAIEEAIPKWGEKVLWSNMRLSESQRLRNELQRQQGRYDMLGSMLQALDLNKDIQEEKITVLEPPSPGAPALRSLPFRLFLAALGGIVLSLGLVFVWYLFDDRFVSVRDVKDQFGEMVLGLVPQIRVPRSRPQAALLQPQDSRGAYVESYRHLRSALLLSQLGQAQTRKLLFTGAGPREGKTTVAANLALVLAHSGLRVALIDADSRGGGIHELLGISEAPGVLDYLRGNASPAQVLHATDIPGLAVVPSGAAGDQADGLFMRPGLKDLILEIEKEREFVILDAPPILSADDAALLVPYSDAVVMVVRPFYTRSRLVHQALDMLYQRKAKHVVIVLNRAREDDLAGFYQAKNNSSHRNGKAV